MIPREAGKVKVRVSCLRTQLLGRAVLQRKPDQLV